MYCCTQCLAELTVIYLSSQTASRKSLARKALYFARRRTDRSLTTLSTSEAVNVWNELVNHRSSLHASATGGALVAQFQFYSDVVDHVASMSRRSSSLEGIDSELSTSSDLQLVNVYGSLVDCVAYLGAEQAACTAFLPPTHLPHAVCDSVDNHEVFLYARAAFASEICFRSLGRWVTPATRSKVLTAGRLYSDGTDGLSACRRRLLPDVDAARPVQRPSAADLWKCGRARRLQQLRRLQLNLNRSTTDAADSMLGQLERDIITSWTDEQKSASWRVAVTVVALSSSLVYLLIGFVYQCRTSLRRCWSPRARANDGDNRSNDVEGRLPCIASSLTKSTSV